MSDTPSEATYKSLLNTFRGTLSKTFPSLTTTVGGAIYDLVLRPLAFMTASADQYLIDRTSTKTMSALSTSQATEDPDADLLMSNYGVVRKTAEAPKVSIRVTTTQTALPIYKGTALYAGEFSLELTDNFYAVFGSGEAPAGYTKVSSFRIPGTGAYAFVITATGPFGAFADSGTQVTGFTSLAGVSDMVLASTLSSVAETETTASMVSRAKAVLSAPVGRDAAIQAMLEASPVSVKSFRAFSIGDPEMCRDQDNAALVSAGGCTDVFVRTSDAALYTGTVSCTPSEGVAVGVLSGFPAGIIRVVTVSVGGVSVDFTQTFGSTRGYPGKVDRGSVYGTVQISFSTAETDPVDAEVTVQYMPEIQALQSWCDLDSNRMAGTSVLIRAAFPAELTISADINYRTSDEASVKSLINTYVDSIGVGGGNLTISDLQTFLTDSGCSAIVESPVFMTAVYIGYSGENASVYSEDGVINVPESDDLTWTPRMYYLTYKGLTQ